MNSTTRDNLIAKIKEFFINSLELEYLLKDIKAIFSLTCFSGGASKMKEVISFDVDGVYIEDSFDILEYEGLTDDELQEFYDEVIEPLQIDEDKFKDRITFR